MIRFLLTDLRGSLATRSLWVFAASLFLGIALIAACSGLLQLVRGGLESQARALFGGDVQLSTRLPIDDAALDWLGSTGRVSLLQELRTMIGTGDGAFTVIELQSVDATYPLYGQVRLAPDMTLDEAVARSPDGRYGAVFDPVLGVELGLSPGDIVTVGDLELELRAAIVQQPDRSLRADVRGPPVIVSQDALLASGLTGPMSVVDYDYRLRLADDDTSDWRDTLRERFPDATWEVRTVEERGELVGERLDQVASVLLLIGFATLLIGGLGVSNGMGAYLQAKRRTLATLQSLGARAAQIGLAFVGQALVVASASSAAGSLVGASVAWLAGRALEGRLPIEARLADLFWPTLATTGFGVLAALVFALPALGRTLSAPPAELLRGDGAIAGTRRLPGRWRQATIATGLLSVALLVVMVPEPMIGLGFVAVALAIAVALEGIVRLVQRTARWLARQPALQDRFALRLALTGLYRPGTALRPMLLSLGTALTVLVASALIVAALMKTLNDSVPARAPALVFYDIQDGELHDFESIVAQQPGIDEVVTAPLVLGRLRTVNGEALSQAEDATRAFEANDEHKLSVRQPGIDATVVDRGSWWPDDYTGPPLVAMEDREADQLGLEVGDVLEFSMLGETQQATLAAIYRQATLETRFWFEAVFSPGVLDRFVTRHVGSAWLTADASSDADIAAMNAIGATFPTVVTIRTARALAAARSILGAAGAAVALVAAVSLIASVLVMASVIAVNRRRQIVEASVMHAIGARMGTILRATLLEYLLLGTVVATFATLLGGFIGQAVLTGWIELPSDGVRLVAPLVAVIAATACLGAAALWLASTLRATPAVLLRSTGREAG